MAGKVEMQLELKWSGVAFFEELRFEPSPEL